MRKRSSRSTDPEMLAESDSTGVRGKNARRFTGGRNIVVIDADVARIFKDAKSVNQALRALSEIIRQQQKKKQKVSA